MAVASSDPLKDMEMMVECPLCLHTFTDPVSLNSCSHTFCQMCLEGLPVVMEGEDQGIECPECRQFSKQGDYKKDFKMNQLIDIYKNMQNRQQRCGICYSTDTKWTCVNCEMDLCQGCKNTHSLDGVNKDHTFQPHNVLMPPLPDDNNFCDIHQEKELKFYCLNCLGYICEICQNTTHRNHKQHTVVNRHRFLHSCGEELVESIQADWDYCKKQDEYLEDQHKELESQCDELLIRYEEEKQRLVEAIQTQWRKTKQTIETIKSDNARAIKTISDIKKAEMKTKMDLIDVTKGAMSNAQDVKVLKFLETCIHKLEAEEKKPLSFSVDVSIPVFTQSPHVTQDVVLLKPPVVFKETRPNVRQVESVRCWDWAVEDVMAAITEKEQEVELLGNPCRLGVVNDNVWVARNSKTKTYEVFLTSDNTLVEIFIDKLDGLYSFWQTSDTEVVAAAVSGLYSLSPVGTLRYKICDSHFSDVCSSEDSLVALECHKCEVHVFRRSDDKWMIQHIFTVNNPDNRFKHLHVEKDVVYISYHWADKIYKYTIGGEYLETFGSTKGGELGQFCGPCVSGTDRHHSLIVCDTGNHHIQVRKSQGPWREYRLPRGITNVRDIVVLQHRLFVLWQKAENDRKLTSYRFPIF